MALKIVTKKEIFIGRIIKENEKKTKFIISGIIKKSSNQRIDKKISISKEELKEQSVGDRIQFKAEFDNGTLKRISHIQSEFKMSGLEKRVQLKPFVDQYRMFKGTFIQFHKTENTMLFRNLELIQEDSNEKVVVDHLWISKDLELEMLFDAGKLQRNDILEFKAQVEEYSKTGSSEKSYSLRNFRLAHIDGKEIGNIEDDMFKLFEEYEFKAKNYNMVYSHRDCNEFYFVDLRQNNEFKMKKIMFTEEQLKRLIPEMPNLKFLPGMIIRFYASVTAKLQNINGDIKRKYGFYKLNFVKFGKPLGTKKTAVLSDGKNMHCIARLESDGTMKSFYNITAGEYSKAPAAVSRVTVSPSEHNTLFVNMNIDVVDGIMKINLMETL
jgi:hypothetical protein